LDDDAPHDDPAELLPAHALTRREAMGLLGASLALAGASGCARGPLESMRPYVSDPPEARPGRPLHYATTMSVDGNAVGLVVEAHDGRPTKIEGNPDHPASLGAAGVLEQASILGLYDPARARAARRSGQPAANGAVLADLARPRTDAGRGLRIMASRTSSPLVGRLFARVLERHPRARVTLVAATATGAAEAGAALCFGRSLSPLPDLGAADVIVAVDADVLGAMPMSLRHARRFADRRRVEGPGAAMNRLYAIEPRTTPTGAIADHRLRRRAGDALGTLAAIVADLLAALGPRAPFGPKLTAAIAPLAAREDRATTAAIARDLVRAGPRALIVVGERQPPEAHALAHLAHAALGATTVALLAPTAIDVGPAAQTLAGLAEDLAAGTVDTLVVLEENIAYAAPAGLDLARLAGTAPRSIYLGLHEDETAALATAFLPAAHYLEAWGDALAYDGTYSLAQPLVAPLFGGRTTAEVLAALAGDPAPDLRALARDSFQARTGLEGAAHDAALRRGFVPGPSAPVPTHLAPRDAIAALARRASTPPPDPAAIELAFAPDPAVLDGRYAENAWLQELPRPVSKLTWGNAAEMSPGLAGALGLANGDRVAIELGGATVTLPALLVAGHADRSVTLHLGFGRRAGGPVAKGVGVDVGPLRPRDGGSIALGAKLRAAGGSEPLATTQWDTSEHGREVALSLTLADLAAKPDFAAHLREPVPSIHATPPRTGEQ
jgi:molybdopterin-containing oxidoreductase family iron-sulfur binding subunit